MTQQSDVCAQCNLCITKFFQTSHTWVNSSIAESKVTLFGNSCIDYEDIIFPTVGNLPDFRLDESRI